MRYVVHYKLREWDRWECLRYRTYHWANWARHWLMSDGRTIAWIEELPQTKNYRF